MKFNRKDYPKKCEQCGRPVTFNGAPSHSCFLDGEHGTLQKNKIKTVRKARKDSQAKYEARQMFGGE